ncbi:MAG: hypothetical protein H0X24_07525 [Ktedonobacterales bacterium]|nr:hypothetical protein [Ktedonobacterales bacterium]
MVDSIDSRSDTIFDHARQAAIALAEAHFPRGVSREQLIALAQENAQFFGVAAGPMQDGDRAMYQGAFLWAYEERRRALVAAPTAAMHQHFIA